MELIRMTFAGERTTIARPVHRVDLIHGQPTFYHGHKGFNWRACRRELNELFLVQRVLFSPLGWLRGFFSSQVWFTCKPRRSQCA